MGKGSGTNTVTQNSQPPEAVLQQYQNLIGQANQASANPIQQYGGSVIAGFTPDQQSAFQTINSSQGLASPYLGNAQNLIDQSTQPLMNGVPQYNQSTLDSYYSPYQNDVVNATQANLNENNAEQQQQVVGNAISRGAWGGDRSAVAQSELARQQKLADNQTIAGLQNQGFTNAQSQLNNQQQLTLGANAQQAGLAQQAAYGETNLGTTAQNSALTGANAQLQSGALQQQLAQEALNIPYEQFQQQQAYPFQNLSWLSGISTGLGAGQGGTSSTTSPGASMTSQLGGLGVAGLGLYGATKKDGGRVGFAPGGGIPDLSLSYIPGPPTFAGSGMGPPAPPKQTSTTKGDQPPDTQALGAAIKGGKAFYNDLPNSASGAYGADSMAAAAYPDMTPLASTLTSPEGAYSLANATSGSGLAALPSLDTASLANAAIVPDLTSSLAAAGTDAAAEAALTDAAAATAADTALTFSPEMLALLALKKGGAVKGLGRRHHMADGGTLPTPYDPYAAGTQAMTSLFDPDNAYSNMGVNPNYPHALAKPYATWNQDDDSDPQDVQPTGLGPPAPPAAADATTQPADPSGLGAATLTPPDPNALAASEPINKVDPWLALATAGFGIAAGNSPHPLENVGSGALLGLKNYQEQKNEAAKEIEQQGTLKERAQQLYQQAMNTREKMTEEHQYHQDEKDHWNSDLKFKEDALKHDKWKFDPGIGMLVSNQGEIKNPYADGSMGTSNPYDESGKPVSEVPDDYFGDMSPSQIFNYRNTVKKNQPKDLQNQQSMMTSLIDQSQKVDDLVKQIPVASSGDMHRLQDFVDRNHVPIFSDPERAKATVAASYDALGNTLDNIRTYFGTGSGNGRVLKTEFDALSKEMGTAANMAPEQKAVVVGKIQERLHGLIQQQAQYGRDIESGMAYMPPVSKSGKPIYQSPMQQKLSKIAFDNSSGTASSAPAAPAAQSAPVPPKELRIAGKTRATVKGKPVVWNGTGWDADGWQP